MEIIEREDWNVWKETEDYIETDTAFIPKKPDTDGIYRIFTKSSAILIKPKNEYERREMHEMAEKKLDAAIADAREFYSKMKKPG